MYDLALNPKTELNCGHGFGGGSADSCGSVGSELPRCLKSPEISLCPFREESDFSVIGCVISRPVCPRVPIGYCAELCSAGKVDRVNCPCDRIEFVHLCHVNCGYMNILLRNRNEKKTRVQLDHSIGKPKASHAHGKDSLGNLFLRLWGSQVGLPICFSFSHLYVTQSNPAFNEVRRSKSVEKRLSLPNRAVSGYRLL